MTDRPPRPVGLPRATLRALAALVAFSLLLWWLIALAAIQFVA